MGVHTRASEIVNEHGFIPSKAGSTEASGASSASYARAAEELGRNMKLEGLVRVYALLESADSTASPRYSIGVAGKRFKEALKKAIDDHPNNKIRLHLETASMRQEIGSMRKRLDEMEQRLGGDDPGPITMADR